MPRRAPLPLVLPHPVDDPITDLGNVLAALGEQRPDELTALLGRVPDALVDVVERAVAQVSDAGWRATPATMAEHFDPTYQRWRYVDLLARKFAGAFRGIEPHQVWNLPSQYGKTTGLMWGVVWALDQNPRLRLLYVSYDAARAVDVGGNARDIIEDHSADLSFGLRSDRRARGMWRTTEGGGLYCVGVNGAITGFPADGLLLDDLLKGWQAAHSEAQRKAVMSVYRSQIRLRVQSSSNPIIVAGTRWHEEDPSGTLVKDAEQDVQADQFVVTRLPAIAEAADPTNADPLLRQPDPLGRKVGEVLEPDRFPEAEVRARAVTLGSYLAAAMEQQRPAPEEGGEILRGWWRWADSPPPRFDDALSSWDMKLKDKETGDYVVGGAWGRTGSKYWCLDVFRGQWNQVTTMVAIALLQVRHPYIKRHVIENTGNGPEVMAELRRPKPGYAVSDAVRSLLGITDGELPAVNRVLQRGMSGLVPENVRGSKTVRMRAQSPLIEAGDVILLERPWAAALVNEFASFPDGAHDDQVDMTSQALKRLQTGSAKATAARGTITPPKPGQRATAVAPRSRIGRVPTRGVGGR